MQSNKKIKERDKLIEFKPYGKLVGCRFLKNGVSFIRISLHSITPCSIWHLENSMCIIDMKRKHNFYFIYFILFLFIFIFFILFLKVTLECLGDTFC